MAEPTTMTVWWLVLTVFNHQLVIPAPYQTKEQCAVAADVVREVHKNRQQQNTFPYCVPGFHPAQKGGA